MIAQAPSKNPRSRGKKVLARLEGSATVKLTTDEILATTRKA